MFIMLSKNTQRSSFFSTNFDAIILFGFIRNRVPPLGIKREGGENPPRSRHCNWGVFLRMPLGLKTWEGEEGDDPEVRRPALF